MSKPTKLVRDYRDVERALRKHDALEALANRASGRYGVYFTPEHAAAIQALIVDMHEAHAETEAYLENERREYAVGWLLEYTSFSEEQAWALVNADPDNWWSQYKKQKKLEAKLIH